MDLTKRIDLHFGKSPVRGEDPKMQGLLDTETEFCAVYAKNDVPADVHNRTSDHMIEHFGANSQFGKDHNGSYVRPYMVHTQTGVATVGPDALYPVNAETLRGTDFRVGGTFFNL
ncbi:hypothetical protein HYS47_03095, partial [Candidatus Woesearchaeota archaeon]|nr:hypothetical protein [Candidatus Woesearchaeota archaeon]